MGFLHGVSQIDMMMDGSGTGHCVGMIAEMAW
jgi:hypothetical protein